MRSSWEIQQSVIKALLARELKTRFGDYVLGYAWVLLEPLLQILILIMVFSVLTRSGYQGVDFALFFTAAVMPFRFFSSTFTGGSNVIQANSGLFAYKQVKPFDALFTRFILEGAIRIVSFVVLIGIFYWWGMDVAIHNPLLMVAAFLLLCLLAFGLSLMACVLSLYVKDATKIPPLMHRPLFLSSCVLFPLISVPPEYREYFLLNPLVHAMELMRLSWFEHYVAPGVNMFYLGVWSISALFLGMITYRANWHKMVGT